MNQFRIGPYSFVHDHGRLVAYLGEPLISPMVEMWMTPNPRGTAEDYVRQRCRAWLQELPAEGPPHAAGRYTPRPHEVMEYACNAVETAMSQTRGTDFFGRMYRIYTDLMEIAGKVATHRKRKKVAA